MADISKISIENSDYNIKDSEARAAADDAINGLSVNDKVITYTKNNGTSGTITTKDTTYGVVSKTANGLAPALPNETTTTKYLRQDGSWQVPPDNNTWKANSASSEGYVASGSGHANKVWKTDADGTPAWRDDADHTYGLATTSANGLLKALPNSTSKWLRGDNSWQSLPSLASSQSGTISGYPYEYIKLGTKFLVFGMASNISTAITNASNTYSGWYYGTVTLTLPTISGLTGWHTAQIQPGQGAGYINIPIFKSRTKTQYVFYVFAPKNATYNFEYNIFAVGY